MHSFVRALPVVLVASALSSGIAEATVRKCTVPGNPIPVALLNGRVIGYFPALPAPKRMPEPPPPGGYVKWGSLEMRPRTVTASVFARPQGNETAVAPVLAPGKPPAPPASNEIAGAQLPAPGKKPAPPAPEEPPARSPFEGIDSNDVYAISVTCLEIAENGVPVTRSVVSMITKRGAPELLNRYLTELVAEQDAYQHSNGTFAASLDDLRFFTSRHTIPIEMTATGDRWTASVSLRGIATACTVSVGGSPSRGVVCSES